MILAARVKMVFNPSVAGSAATLGVGQLID
jgi:hypothetical protein